MDRVNRTRFILFFACFLFRTYNDIDLDLCVLLSITALQWLRRYYSNVSLDDLFYNTDIRLFPHVDVRTMHKSFIHTLKYLCNYGTYRFGLELSQFALLCLIIVRMDAISLIHANMLVLCLLLSRQNIRRFWKLYRLISSILTIWLYLNALGKVIMIA
jgi:hypothetical protein